MIDSQEVHDEVGHAIAYTVSWPCRVEELVAHVRAALSRMDTQQAAALHAAMQVLVEALQPVPERVPRRVPGPGAAAAGGTIGGPFGAALSAGTPPALTRREREVVALVTLGATNREIAQELLVAEGTVAIHVGNIMRKMGFRSRAQIATWAAESRRVT